MLDGAITIAELGDHVGETVRMAAWVTGSRPKGKICFLLLRDGTGVCQAVASAQGTGEAAFERAGHLHPETSVIITGDVAEDERAPGGFEFKVADLEVVGDSHDYPIGRKEHGVGFLQEVRHLWLRSPRQTSILRIRDTLVRGMRDWLHSQGFTNVDTPIFTPSACEGTSTLFEVDYFGESAYLSQSGQLYSEAAVMALGKVYCFGPTFRAEASKTRRHLTEFWMLEPEWVWADLDDICRVSEDLVAAAVARVLEENAADLEILERDPAPLEAVVPPFPRMTYEEASAFLVEAGTGFEPGSDLGAPDETALSDAHGTPVFVTHWPAEIKAFYMKRDPDNEAQVLAVDMIAPEGNGELIGEPNPESYEPNVRGDAGLLSTASDYSCFLRMFRHHC